MQTILGAGGVIATELVKELVQRRERIRVIAPRPEVERGQVVSADVSMLDQAVAAVTVSSVVYLLAAHHA